MKFIDLCDDKVYSLLDLFQEWQTLKTADPANHADTFKRELFDIIDATLRGRNDLEIVGLTSLELSNIYNQLIMEV